MRRIFSVLGAVALCASMAGTALGRPHGDVTLRMHAQSGSGESGSATLTPLRGGRTRVVLDIKNENTTGDQPVHIHYGSCAHLNPVPRYPLKNVVLGHSNTIVDAPMSKLMSGHMAINVHESAAQLKKYVSCGDLRSM
ncbi:MAG: hypothetical protein GIW99_07320 [Candidatus Eremiobacteraeota bacterium]|nr:hypothetical protein [Candidatus Eremiobacteraeota bacterium]MBC5827473.1 hypothetical protein [Candidatus Eremiobacteraeota bacterium]